MSDKKHTPIISEKQRGLFGAELARKRAGKETKTGMSEEQLVEHLHESRGKNLPEKIEKEKMPLVNPHASSLQQDKQLRQQLRWLKDRGLKTAEEGRKFGELSKSLPERISDFVEKGGPGSGRRKSRGFLRVYKPRPSKADKIISETIERAERTLSKSLSNRIDNFMEKQEKEPQIPGVAWDYLTPEQKIQIRHTRPDLFVKKGGDI